ncbi:DUF5992 family protein [Aliikangiella maris]|uniref:DUF5992 family protein n=2 Tax=Aliikangiella maris TaxID=3162458 RepID=A0ABV3MSI3_9GAMM
MKKYKILSLLLLLASGNCFSGELVKNAEITRVGTSSDGVTDNIFITVSGGSGPCANMNIIFLRENAPSAEFFNRLYSTALFAFSTGSKKVRVYNPTSDSCTTATYIDLMK